MGPLNTMTEANTGPGVAGARYNAAGQMTVMGQESRSHNSMGQLTGTAGCAIRGLSKEAQLQHRQGHDEENDVIHGTCLKQHLIAT